MADQRGLNAAHAGMFPNLRRDVAFPVVGVGLLFGAFIAVGLLYQSLFSGAAERLVTIALIDAIIVLGIQIYVGNTGVLSFGHIGFGAIAGYTFAIFAIAPAEKAKRIPDAPFGLTDVDVGSWAAVAVAVAVTVVVAVFVGIGLARSGAESGAVAATVITLALLFVTHEVARHWPEMTGGERAGLSFRIGGALDTRMPIYLALAGALVLCPPLRPKPARAVGQGRPRRRPCGPGHGGEPHGPADDRPVDLGGRGVDRREPPGLRDRFDPS